MTERMRGYYHRYRYEIVDADTGETMCDAGNSRHDSADLVSLSSPACVDLETMRDYCEKTGRRMAGEILASWEGVEYDGFGEKDFGESYDPVAYREAMEGR